MLKMMDSLSVQRDVLELFFFRCCEVKWIDLYCRLTFGKLVSSLIEVLVFLNASYGKKYFLVTAVFALLLVPRTVETFINAYNISPRFNV